LITSEFASELHFPGRKSPEIAWGRDLNSVFVFEKVDRWNPIRTPAIPSRSLTFPRSEWNVVRSASLAKGGTSKKRPSPHLHKVPIQSNKVSPLTFQTALIIIDIHMSEGTTSNNSTNNVKGIFDLFIDYKGL
jgi:hypothetical protein